MLKPKKKLKHFVIILFYFSIFNVIVTFKRRRFIDYHSSYGAYIIKYGSLNWLKSADLMYQILFRFTEIFNFID